MKKILVVDLNATAPTYTYYFVEGLQHGGMEVDVLGAENKNFTSYHENRLNYKGLGLGKKSINYIINWIWLLINAKRYAAIHLQWLQLLKYSSIEIFLVKILKHRNRNIFYTVHNFLPHNSVNEKVNERYVTLYKVIDNLVVHATSTISKINVKVGPKASIKIDHGYFYSEFVEHEKDNSTIDLLMCGSIRAYKGIEDAIETVALLKREGTYIRLVIAGNCDDSYLQKLDSMIKEKKLESEVVLKIGFIPVARLVDLYKNAALSILPYKEIEQSGVLFTSLGLGVPVVGYEVGGFSETIIDGHNGYLVEKNNVSALAEAVKSGLRNRSKLRENILSDIRSDLWAQNAKVLKREYYR